MVRCSISGASVLHNSQDDNNQKLWRVTMEYSKEDLMEAKKQIFPDFLSYTQIIFRDVINRN